MRLRVVDVSVREVLRLEDAADTQLEATDAEHSYFGHLCQAAPDLVLYEVVLVGGVGVTVDAIPLSLTVMQLTGDCLRLLVSHVTHIIERTVSAQQLKLLRF